MCGVQAVFGVTHQEMLLVLFCETDIAPHTFVRFIQRGIVELSYDVDQVTRR